MRWATFRSGAGPAGHVDRVGLVVDDEVRALEPGVALVDLLDDESLERAAATARAHPAEIFPLALVQLRPPIPRPPSIRDFAAFPEHLNTGLRAMDRELGEDYFKIPVFYFSNPGCVKDPGSTVRVPGHSTQVDFEVEVAAIIGTGGMDIRPADAESHIAGFCIFNDWSARDLQRQEMHAAPLGLAKGKDFAHSLGPVLVTRDELEPYRRDNGYEMRLEAWVNGRRYTDSTLRDIHWGFADMVAYASRDTELRPGDVLGSGTCVKGCILELSIRYGSDEYPWLRDGDEVAIEAEHLGRLVNRVSWGPRPADLLGT